jgi:hypothetical protein
VILPLVEVEALGVIEFTTDGNSKRPILRDGTEAISVSILLLLT